MQDAFGLDQPDYGYLLAGTFAYEGTTLAREQFHRTVRRTRAGLRPGRDSLRGPNVTVADVITAIDYAIPAIEIIDSRVQNWAIALPDTLADNGSTGAVILGGTPRRITDLTLRDTRGVLRFNGREVISGNTKHPRQSSGRRRLAGQPARRLRRRVRTAGQVILPGSCLQAVPMNQAGHWSGTFEGWGTIEFDVSNE